MFVKEHLCCTVMMGRREKLSVIPSQQFMDVLELINKSADPRIVEYTDISTTED